MLYARHHPAAFDLTGLSPVQLDAVPDALVMLIDAQRQDAEGLDWETAEQFRLKHCAAIDVLRATNGAVREANGEDNDDA
jgi:hypothetical protein